MLVISLAKKRIGLKTQDNLKYNISDDEYRPNHNACDDRGDYNR